MSLLFVLIFRFFILFYFISFFFFRYEFYLGMQTILREFHQ